MTQKRPDIALFGDFAESGGACRTLVNQIKVWDRLGYRVAIVTYRDGRRFYPDEMPERVETCALGTRSKHVTVLALWRFLSRRRPRVLLSTTHLTNLIVARAACLPSVDTHCWLSVHNDFVHSQRRQDSRRLQQKLRSVRRVYPRAAGVIAVSEGVRRGLVETLGLPTRKVHAIHNAVVDESVLSRADAPADHPWLVDKTAPVIMAVGRLARQKDYPTLIRAFARVLEHRAVRLIILGEGPERLDLERLIAELDLGDHVAMPGFVDNPYAWMARSDLFVLSSTWEGFGNVVAEALAVGVPVVATDCPSGPAEILDHGRYGRLCPPGDPEALAAGILKSMDGDHPEYDPRTAVHAFTSEVSATRYLEVLGLNR